MRKSRLAQLFLFSAMCFGYQVTTPAFARSEKLIHQYNPPKVIKVEQINATTVDLIFENNQRMSVDFYGNNIFRLFRDNKGGMIREPEAKPAAKILVDNPRRPVHGLTMQEADGLISIATDKIKLTIQKADGLLRVYNFKTDKEVLNMLEPVVFEDKKVTLTFQEYAGEYFYGGGVQNGRFSHKGKAIAIENQNSWTDGGVASPNPFYWSTRGYGLMWHTFKKGKYDFGAKEPGTVSLYHETDYLDVFIMVDDGAVPLLNDFYQLTGNPVLLPKFGFYQGHLNAYNRDYWKEDEKGILFEDGKRYKESQKDNGGIKESLNGEKNNYQFSARAVIDRYKEHDMPLGWVLPNDGYGAGYGQTETLEGNVANLKSFGDYARKNGVEIGLWTQSDLHPKADVSALLQRDIIREVRDAGVRVLKTDVAWVGAGYSFGLNGVADVGQIMPYYGHEARPFIISLDGWAGTQRYAGIWSGDQTGGAWEYIRFHIPTYIGSGLSGNPNITSDMDGIFGGKNPIVNTRDFQWKTFTPMQLNMDGWGTNEKYPHALGEPTTSINRAYLKWKSELMPYAYNIAHEAVDGLPMIRATFLETANRYTLGKATQYQFLYGPYFLVAPIYQNTKADEEGDDVRNGIYLPEGEWIDYFTGQKYKGNRVLNNFDAPLWKLPVLVKNGAIIPLVNPNNNPGEIDETKRIYEVYPSGNTSFVVYDDDGKTEAYRNGEAARTEIRSVQSKNRADITVMPTKGDFPDFVKDKTTEFRVNVTEKPKKITAKIGRKKVKLSEVKDRADLETNDAVFFYEEAPNFNRFATANEAFAETAILRNPQLLVKLPAVDVTQESVSVRVEGFTFEPQNPTVNTGTLTAPADARVTEENTKAYDLIPTWQQVGNADYYEIMFDSLLYTTIRDTSLLFDGLQAESDYDFQLRAVNKDGRSDWTSFSAKTKSDPLEFAIAGIVGTTTAANQEGSEIDKLFDYDEGNLWHTKWGQEAVPFDLVMDLKSINQLDKFHYLPRTGRGNGILLKGKVYYSMDAETWSEAGDFTWDNNDDMKVFTFADQPVARFVKLAITEGVGGFGSGRELYVFKVPGTESYLPGDINNDRLIDMNDFTSYTNYMGLRLGDADFEGYVSNGDVNKNNLIDAYDISVVATQLRGGAKVSKADTLGGKITLSANKVDIQAGDMVEITVKGAQLSAVNALSFALPYDQEEFEFVQIKPLAMKAMENLTNDRLHTNGNKALYPTFVNIGDQETLKGSEDLFVIRMKAKKNVRFSLKAIDGFLVDKQLHIVHF